MGEDWVSTTGLMRSRVVRKVMTKHTRQMTAQSIIVICQPCARSLPRANLATSGRVKPPTMNCAMLTATKR